MRAEELNVPAGSSSSPERLVGEAPWQQKQHIAGVGSRDRGGFHWDRGRFHWDRGGFLWDRGRFLWDGRGLPWARGERRNRAASPGALCWRPARRHGAAARRLGPVPPRLHRSAPPEQVEGSVLFASKNFGNLHGARLRVSSDSHISL